MTFLSSLKRKREFAKVIKAGNSVSGLGSTTKRRRRSVSSQQQHQVVVLFGGGGGNRTTSTSVSQRGLKVLAETRASIHQYWKKMKDKSSGKLKIGVKTLQVIKTEIINNLQQHSTSGSTLTVASMVNNLSKNTSIEETYAIHDDPDDDEDKKKDPIVHLTKVLKQLSVGSNSGHRRSGRNNPMDQRRMKRRYDLRDAFNRLEKGIPNIMNNICNSVDDVLVILSNVFILPTNEEVEKYDKEEADKVAIGIGSTSSKGSFLWQLEEVATKARNDNLRPSSIKWKQIALHPPLAKPYSSMGEEGVDQQKRQVAVDDSSSGIMSTVAVQTSSSKQSATGTSGATLSSSLELADKQFIFGYESYMAEHLARTKSKEVAEIEARLKEKEREEEAAKKALSLMRPLTSDEQQIVRNAMYDIGPSNEVIAQVGTDSIQRGSIHTLQPGTWLNDEVIHYFYVMLSKRDEELCTTIDPTRKRSHFFKSFFMTKLLNEGHSNPALDGKYEYRNVKRWSKKVPGKDIFNLDKIFFPINEQRMHWLCGVIDISNKQIQIYDSMGGDGTHYLNSLFQYIQDEHLDKKKMPLPNKDDWELIECTSNTPRQRNGTYLCKSNRKKLHIVSYSM